MAAETGVLEKGTRHDVLLWKADGRQGWFRRNWCSEVYPQESYMLIAKAKEGVRCYE